MSVDGPRFVVITSIAAPTDAVIRFSRVAGYGTVVVGDRKTPAPWQAERVAFLPAQEQDGLGYGILDKLPWNHYARKMVGYLWAMERGAQVIVDTDDDNTPKPGWAMPPFEAEYDLSRGEQGFVNIYRSFTAEHVWPRGFPLEQITDPAAAVQDEALRRSAVRVGVWQGLADGDPDVDAIYRLTCNRPVWFRDREPIVLDAGTLCPFNSQNTAYRRETFPLLYLPAHVTFRFTDILRGLVAQPILWRHGYRLGFTGATVVQERNPHNYLTDFRSEIPCYLHAARVIEVVDSALTPGAPIGRHLQEAYLALHRAELVPAEELPLVDAWVDDVARLSPAAMN